MSETMITVGMNPMPDRISTSNEESRLRSEKIRAGIARMKDVDERIKELNLLLKMFDIGGIAHRRIAVKILIAIILTRNFPLLTIHQHSLSNLKYLLLLKN